LAENTKTQAENSLKEASLLLNRNNILYKQKVISLQDLENSKLQLDIAKLDLEKANNLYKNMVLVAPFDGIMGGVSYVEGEYINSVSQSPELLFSIIDPSSKQFIIFYLPEILMDKIAQGSDVNVFYKDKVYKCKVVTKSNYISKTNGGFFVKLELDDNKLPDGAYVMAEFVFNKHMALTVPEYALMKKANGNMVYVVNDDKAKAVNVNIGSRLAGNVEILSDQINQNSNVVMQGLVKLSDGAIVKVEQNKVN
jgi:RND family efflux transporter MFP subunit